MAFHGYSPTVSDPFRAPCDTCSESSSSGFWTGGELRTAFSDEVGPCLPPWMIVLRLYRPANDGQAEFAALSVNTDRGWQNGRNDWRTSSRTRDCRAQ